LSRSKQPTEIGLGQSARLHSIADGVDGIGWIDRPAFALIVLYYEREQVESIGIR